MKFTYYGHACFAVELDNIRLLFDPFISGNPLPAARSIDVDAIKADYILISHGHGDHLADATRIAKNTGAMLIGNAEMGDMFAEQGFNAHGMNIGGQANFRNGKFFYGEGDLKVKCVVAQHSSGMPDGAYAGNPVGFIVWGGGRSFYYSGDTGLTMDMQLIPRWARLDFAVLPIGDNYTMGADDAVECARMIQCKTVIGVHYNTFDDVIRIDTGAAQRIFSEAGYELKLPAIGETIDLA